MSGENQIPDYIVQLDAARRSEIDSIKKRMEDFLLSPVELKHSMELVAKGQESLKERFEVGAARTLRELKDTFDLFRVEWGEKKAQDLARDTAIKVAQKTADDAKEDFRKYLLWPVITICASVVMATLAYIANKGGL
jgi:hypothetical protein